MMAAITNSTVLYVHRSEYPLATGDACYRSLAVLKGLLRLDTYSRHLPPLSHTRTRCARFLRKELFFHAELINSIDL